ncbi:MAG: class I SAM-dependent methyltransferase [Gammaproteobacteria bacterium]|nr:class I SAM-dependent methyltransferase [Gammaproteobacteria bacterium]
MTPPYELLFDLETLINSAQPSRILLLGNVDPAFLDEYVSQKQLINQPCEVVHFDLSQLDKIWDIDERFDVGIALNLFEHIEQAKGHQVLSRLRDVLTPQYCLALPLSQQSSKSSWQLTDLFSFALSKVNSYDTDEVSLTLFKYNIEDYKPTPDWLNADNWANPHLWGKYWW